LARWLPVLIILIAVAAIIWLRLRKRPTPQEIERQRRMAIHREGKMGNGQVIDVVTEPKATEPESVSIVYSYSVAGVAQWLADEPCQIRKEAALSLTSTCVLQPGSERRIQQLPKKG
jgi:hypothetical protein